MPPLQSDIPKYHQDRTWSIYEKSVPQLFIERAASRPDAVALRYKDFGLYQEKTWRQYRDETRFASPATNEYAIADSAIQTEFSQ